MLNIDYYYSLGDIRVGSNSKKSYPRLSFYSIHILLYILSLYSIYYCIYYPYTVYITVYIWQDTGSVDPAWCSKLAAVAQKVRQILVIISLYCRIL